MSKKTEDDTRRLSGSKKPYRNWLIGQVNDDIKADDDSTSLNSPTVFHSHLPISTSSNASELSTSSDDQLSDGELLKKFNHSVKQDQPDAIKSSSTKSLFPNVDQRVGSRPCFDWNYRESVAVKRSFTGVPTILDQVHKIEDGSKSKEIKANRAGKFGQLVANCGSFCHNHCRFPGENASLVQLPLQEQNFNPAIARHFGPAINGRPHPHPWNEMRCTTNVNRVFCGPFGSKLADVSSGCFSFLDPFADWFLRHRHVLNARPMNSDRNISCKLSFNKNKADKSHAFNIYINNGFVEPFSHKPVGKSQSLEGKSSNPCRCQFCHKTFGRPWLLQGHLRTHTGEKPFQCLLCGRAFADRSNLRAHAQTHSAVKKYKCNTCNRTFSRLSLLAKHKLNCSVMSQSPMERWSDK